jgi:hypothetical protein
VPPDECHAWACAVVVIGLRRNRTTVPGTTQMHCGLKEISHNDRPQRISCDRNRNRVRSGRVFRRSAGAVRSGCSMPVRRSLAARARNHDWPLAIIHAARLPGFFLRRAPADHAHDRQAVWAQKQLEIVPASNRLAENPVTCAPARSAGLMIFRDNQNCESPRPASAWVQTRTARRLAAF